MPARGLVPPGGVGQRFLTACREGVASGHQKCPRGKQLKLGAGWGHAAVSEPDPDTRGEFSARGLKFQPKPSAGPWQRRGLLTSLPQWSSVVGGGRGGGSWSECGCTEPQPGLPSTPWPLRSKLKTHLEGL